MTINTMQFQHHPTIQKHPTPVFQEICIYTVTGLQRKPAIASNVNLPSQDSGSLTGRPLDLSAVSFDVGLHSHFTWGTQAPIQTLPLSCTLVHTCRHSSCVTSPICAQLLHQFILRKFNAKKPRSVCVHALV